MSLTFVVFVPGCFAAIHLLGFTGIMARLIGIRSRSHMIGYSTQQEVYVGTRLFMVMLLPMLGLVVDTRIEMKEYRIMAVSALAGAAVLSLFAYLIQDHVVGYYRNVIAEYQRTGNFPSSFVAVVSATISHHVPFNEVPRAYQLLLTDKAGLGILLTYGHTVEPRHACLTMQALRAHQ